MQTNPRAATRLSRAGLKGGETEKEKGVEREREKRFDSLAP